VGKPVIKEGVLSKQRERKSIYRCILFECTERLGCSVAVELIGRGKEYIALRGERVGRDTDLNGKFMRRRLSLAGVFLLD
jgi:hypothetical protein